MSARGWIVAVQIVLSASPACFGQAPSNDNLTNSIVLTGTDVTFTGSLAGATLEDTAEESAFTDLGVISGSIWWSWTAPVSTVLNLEVQFPTPFAYYPWLDGLAVYSATNGTTSPAGLLQPPVGQMDLFLGVNHETLSIPVSAGTNYRIQLIGGSANNYTLHLLATNAPLIFKPPLSQTVYSNESALFYVESGGLQPRTYQWYFNGTNIPGETAPLLALNEINASNAGVYSVLVSNASGSAMSQAATLAISPSNVPPKLTLRGGRSNLLEFTLTGEIGRSYQIESSTDLIHWNPEASFPPTPLPAPQFLPGIPVSIVFNTNASQQFTVTNNLARKFYRASIYVPNNLDSEICINNLRQIFVAKLLWQTDANAYLSVSPTYAELLPYFPHPQNLVCPEFPTGTFAQCYNISNLTTSPVCIIDPAHHKLQGVP